MNKNAKKTHFEEKYFEEIDKVAENNIYFIPILNIIKNYLDLRNDQILDVGCGTGIFLSYLINRGAINCYGVDGDSNYYNRALKRGYQDVKIVNDLNYDILPFENGTFDLVFCKDVFEHLLKPIHTISEINRVTKNNKYLLLHVPNHFPLYSRFKFIFTNNIDTFHYFKNESRWTFPHIRFYEYADFINILKKNNFDLVLDLSYHFPVIPILSNIKILNKFIKYLVNRYPNNFAGAFTLLLKKNDNEIKY